MRTRLILARIALMKTRDKVLMKIVWLLPRSVVMWCYIRVVAHATTGEYDHTNPGHLNTMEALRRLHTPNGGDPRWRRAR